MLIRTVANKLKQMRQYLRWTNTDGNSCLSSLGMDHARAEQYNQASSDGCQFFPASWIINLLALSLNLQSYYEAKHPSLSKIKNNKVSEKGYAAEGKAVCTLWAPVTTALPVPQTIDSPARRAR